MNGLSTIWALLSSLWYTKVRGGRIKRLLALIFSSIVVGYSIYLMHKWTTITISKHVLVFDHPMTTDTTKNHYCKLDVRIKSNEGFTLQERNKDLLLFESAFEFRYLNKDKNIDTSLPEEHDPHYFNYVIGKEVLVENPNYKNTMPIKDANNLLVIGHYYNSNYTNIHVPGPFEGVSRMASKDKDGEIRRTCGYVFMGEPRSILIPLGKKYHERICKDVKYFTSDFQVDWFYILSPESDDPLSFGGFQHGENNSFNYKELFNLHDITKKKYQIYLYSRSIDEISFRLETNESVEFSSTWSRSKKGKNSIRFNFKGDHIKDNDTGPLYMEFYARNIESENAQRVRMFFIMTLCSFALGYFFKNLSEYIWILIRKIQKKEGE